MFLRILLSASLVAASITSVLAQDRREGSISGTISFPGEAIPAVRIYALAEGGKTHYVVSTLQNQSRFEIKRVPEGKYFVVAYPIAKGEASVAGAWTRFVQCGMQAQCRDHSLVPIAVTAGNTTTGVKLADWYAPPGTFPQEPTREPPKTANSDCTQKGSNLAEGACNLQAYERADKALNQEYRRVIAALDKLPTCKERLKNAQRAWVMFRDEHCRYDGTTAYKGRTTECLKEITVARAEYLKQQSPELCHP